MSGINYKKFRWREKEHIILPLEIILLIINCLDNITICTFLRTSKFWYNRKCNPYYLYNPEKYIVNPYNYILVRDTKSAYIKLRKIVNLHEYYCCRLYLDFYNNMNACVEFTFFGFITNAPLDLFKMMKIKHVFYETKFTNLMGKITNYDFFKKIDFETPIVSRSLNLFPKIYKPTNQILDIYPGRDSEYLNGRHEAFKQHNIDVIHTTHQKFNIGEFVYFICCITSAPRFELW